MRAKLITTAVTGASCLLASVLASAPARAGGSPLPTEVNHCWSTDNGAPVVDAFTLSTHTVDVTSGPATVTLTIDAHDTGGPGPATGIAGIEVQARTSWPDPTSPDADHGGSEIRLHRVGSDWVGRYTIPQHSQATQVRFQWVGVLARNGVNGSYNAQLGPDPATVDVTSSARDTEPPHVSDVVLSKKRVHVANHGRDVVVTAQVTDDDSGVASVGLAATGTVGRRPHPMTPTGTAGEYRSTVHVPRRFESDRMHLSFFTSDAVGNEEVTSVAGAEISVVGSAPAKRARIVSVNGRHQQIRVRRPHAHWNIRVHARDAGSGVATVSTYLPMVVSSRRLPVPIKLHLIRGTRRDGVWGARIAIPRCIKSPGHFAASYVTVTDRSGLMTRVLPRGPRLVGPDHVPPYVSGDSGVGSVGVDFREAVHGISASTVTVYGEEPDGDLVPQQGSWTCRDRSHHQVSCRRGAVRHADFRYDGPVTGKVDFEPDGQIDVLDRHGNPVFSPLSFDND